ncbi:cupin-like domain-containing protein [Winogradskya humida]|uniref:cupin-like domain-containing protein n=1 Tax=Winogradskya humida TaxID=113566 RepID=UPI0019453215|nr:cupin-like domain-containing protein [Actinoplanes humidus]
MRTGSDLTGDLVRDIPELASAETVLRSYRQTVSLLRKQGPHAAVVGGESAIPALGAGFTCYLKHVQRDVPGLVDLLGDACDVLGLPAGSMTAEVFCSDGASGVAMHSDFDVNFAMLLSGSKRWLLAPNDSIVNQTSMCFPASRRQPDPKQLHYADAPFPDRMPDGAREVTVGAGGLIFLPRGWWHETYSSGPCLQLNLVVKGPHWTSVLTTALRDYLLARPEWRQYAYGMVGDGERHEGAVAEFAGLIAELQRRLGDADPRALAEQLLAGLDHEALEIGSSRRR